MRRFLLAAAFTLGIGFLAASQSEAVHKGAGDLTCGQCHTMHNSQGGSSLGGNADGSLVLLRGAVTTRAEIHNFCFQCHATDGAQATSTFLPHNQTAPKILLAGAWTESTAFTAIGAGGDFQPACGNVAGGVWNCQNDGGASAVAIGKGHSLGLTNVAPPGYDGGSTISAFTCTSCHDPHGTVAAGNATINGFRNLRKTPTDSGANSDIALSGMGSWVGGIHGTNFTPTGAGATAIWPIISAAPTGTPATDTANSNYYGAGATGISKWCSSCHDKWHETNQASNQNGNDWQRHPVDNLLTDATPNSGAGVQIFDSTQYSATTAGRVLPVASGQAANKVFYLVGAAQDKVMCLSCHFAHGGPYYDNLRWDYLQSVSAGDQTAKGVPLTKGCQLCHNRGG